jgi:sugar phosphate isomerase/epimerase
MDRREFLALTGAAAMVPLGAPRWLPHGTAATPVDSLDNIGLQLYTLRERMEFSVERTLYDVAGIGYKEVEFAGYFGRPPRAIKQLLDRNGLKSPSAHVGLDTMRSGWYRTLNEASQIGHKWLVIAWLPPEDRNSIDAVKRSADLLNRSARDAETFKIKVAYHNHDWEFQEVEGRRIFDILLEETDPEVVQFEMDLYWITKAGADPMAYFARWPERFPLLHLKDSSGAPEHAMTEVGKGTIDFAQVFRRAGQAGIRHCYVEHDNPADPMASVATSFRYLDGLEF